MVNSNTVLLKRTIKYVHNKIRKKYNITISRLIGKKYTKNDIINDLKKIGVNEGDNIYVHSSLSRIGYVEGGAVTLIDALLQTIGDNGTLIMPAFTIHDGMKNTLESGFIFDPNNSKITVGFVPETFRKMTGVCRSIHPTHSVCAYGKLAKWISKGHERCQSTFGEGTPFQKFIHINGKIIGIGLDIAPISFYHSVEELENNFPIKVHCDEKLEVKLLDNNGNIITMKVLPYNPEIARTRIDQEANLWIRKFITQYFRKKKVLKEGLVGKGPSYQIAAKDFYKVQIELMRKGITIYTTKDEYLNIQKN